ncbi:MAG: RluA family pseudouridine synthase [Myxococcota bacterium]|nr:RluA family pseudouridine synthase [Myxococcota bacterium]
MFRFPSPFAREPHPLARAAAERLMAELPPAPREGKMFGVLVGEDRAGAQITLRAFSGMLDGAWHVDGFVPPAFDTHARDAVWPEGERELAVLATRLAAIDTAKERELAALDAQHASELEVLRARHRANRDARRTARASGGDPNALDQASRGDGAEKRRLVDAHDTARAPLAAEVARIVDERRAIEHQRAERSRFYLHALFDTYRLPNARGETTSLRALFAPDEPPGGAGDCAAPKLLAHAYREGARPIALAEFWWGPPPVTGGRHHGAFYPACRGKCGPVLGHMLQGLDTDPAPAFERAVEPNAPALVFEDEWLVIVDKPVGLLSVPGKSQRDSVQTRLTARYGEAHLVHRLDLDASGLILVAKDRVTHAALQRLFACRQIDKQYVAWLDGQAMASSGVVELALRVDLDDRPRQIYDPVHGKAALTEWRVIERRGGRTRVALFPRTGRAHQLRVHAAHPLGIGVPIVGDPLYGREAERLLLHAEALSFVHPHTKRDIGVTVAAPF